MSKLKSLEELQDYEGYKKDLRETLKRRKGQVIDLCWTEELKFTNGKSKPILIAGSLNSQLKKQITTAGHKLKIGTGVWSDPAKRVEALKGMTAKQVDRALKGAKIEAQPTLKDPSEPDVEVASEASGAQSQSESQSEFESESESESLAERPLTGAMARRMQHAEQEFATRTSMDEVRKKLKGMSDSIKAWNHDPRVAAEVRKAVTAAKGNDAQAAADQVDRLERLIAQVQRAGGGGAQQGQAGVVAQSAAAVLPARVVRAPSTFVDQFTPQALAQLARDIDRGGLKGKGDFGKVLADAAKLLKQKDEPARTKIPLVEALIVRLQSYLSDRDKNDDANFKDDIERKKITQGRALLAEARNFLQDLLEQQDQRVANLLSTGELPPDKEAGYRQLKAGLLLKCNGARRPGGGTSDVQLIKNSDGQVAFAFKSIEGETAQTKMKPGGAAVREALASNVAETIRQQVGLDFGFPRVTIATVAGKKGALVEGLHGVLADPEEINLMAEEEAILALQEKRNAQLGAEGKPLLNFDQAMMEAVALQTEERKKASALAAALPAAEVQKTILCNLAMAQYDIKWGNVIMEPDDSGSVRARPFDAGAAFPTDDSMALVRADDFKGAIKPGETLICDPITQMPLPSAQQPLDPALVQQFCTIDTTALAAAMTAERSRLAKSEKLGADLLSDQEASRSVKSIQIIQEILTQDPTMTTEAFVNAYHARMGEIT